LTTYISDAKYEASFIHETPKTPTQINITHIYIEERIGTKALEATIIDILTRLGFIITGNAQSQYSLTVPSWRDT
jgi:phenylalanyl-tRNA synthetase beta subunit